MKEQRGRRAYRCDERKGKNGDGKREEEENSSRRFLFLSLSLSFARVPRRTYRAPFFFRALQSEIWARVTPPRAY